MKAILKISLLLHLVLTSAGLLCAQSPTQVIIANGGVGGDSNLVRMATWELGTGNYTVFDSIPAGSVQSVFVWGRDAYVCADSLLIRYNLDTYQREAAAMIKGVRRVAVWEDKVLISKGNGSFTDHFEVRYADNLLHCFSVPAIIGNCNGVVVAGDSGYVANPISFVNPTGNMAVIDMRGTALNRIMDMDTMGKFIDQMYTHQGKIVSTSVVKVNNPQWGFVSLYDISNGTFTHHKVNMPLSQGAGIDNGKLYANFGGNVGGFDLASGQLTDPVVVPGAWKAMVVDSINNRLYLTRSDLQTYGWLISFDYTGTRLDSVETGIAPVALAVDYNVTVGNQPSAATGLIHAFPQPFSDRLQVDLRNLKHPARQLQIFDLTGNEVYTTSLNVSDFLTVELPELAAGVYLLQVNTRSESAILKIVKAPR
jgi:hypothetical protein